MISWLVIVLVAIGIYALFEVFRFKHKIVAILLIILFVFFSLSFVVVFKDRDVDWNTISGVSKAAGMYTSWFSLAWENAKIVTGNIIHMDWGRNQTAKV